MAQTRKLPKQVSAVTVTDPIDGRKHRRSPVSYSSHPRTDYSLKVPDELMAAARRIMRAGERIRVLDKDTVLLVPDNGR